MDVIVTFRHIEPAESLRLYAEEKLQRINKYFDFPVDAHVVLEVEKFRHIADVTLNLDGTRIKAVEETSDMYSAIDQVIDTLENQIKRYRSKIRTKRADLRKREEQKEEQAIEGSETQALDMPTIEVERIDVKPMDPEEAAMQLSLSSRDFMVFRNSKSMEVNVIYKKKDGNLGLIDPSLK